MVNDVRVIQGHNKNFFGKMGMELIANIRQQFQLEKSIIVQFWQNWIFSVAPRLPDCTILIQSNRAPLSSWHRSKHSFFRE
jgi:hypothetical protein